ncbi:hypothetical protein DSM106972_046260 [Dulcicalothrix desertica PCC 7102]|uniref:Uncharacterized protein n=1 Tax=Dulcicalothrix desertica PCC 7102 TaxID=232991 RepID=A0A3S1AMM5_9CYAN|nr:hypothetical protein [Dulcicalothrix desertica]RUT04398.1 hypothetical protein DSM106972_046260 [Dulcicalothrix desertica PCC 7102]TWH51252.1 hypothetical protein CAL7102_05646 [Dulcicalothrix desertica PCC 7102]
MYEAHIEISRYYEPIPDLMVPIYTDHYQKLIHIFAPTCNFFELSFWREEAQALQDAEQKIYSNGKRILKKIDYPSYTPVRLVSELSPTIVDELLIKPFGEYGRVKWFGLSLGKASDLTLKQNIEKSIILDLSHWGREIHIYKMSEEELEEVQSIFSYLRKEYVNLHVNKL